MIRLLTFWLISQILSIVVWYFAGFSRDNLWWVHILYFLPIILIPFISFLFKKFFNYYFSRIVAKEENELIELKKKQKEILEEYKKLTDYHKIMKFIDNYESKLRKEQAELDKVDQQKIAYQKRMEQETKRRQEEEIKHRELNQMKKEHEIQQLQQKLQEKEALLSKEQREKEMILSQKIPPSALADGLRKRQMVTQMVTQPVAPMPYRATGPPNIQKGNAAASAAKMSFFDKMASWVVGDDNVEVRCDTCSSVNASIPKDEAPFFRFICFNCGKTNGGGLTPRQVTPPPLSSSPSPSLPDLKTLTEDKRERDQEPNSNPNPNLGEGEVTPKLEQ